MNDNQLTIVKEHEFDNPLIQKIDAPIDNYIGGCHNNYFHTFDHICEYDLNFTIITNNETVKFTISEQRMDSYELGKKLAIARERRFIFNQINNFKIKTYSNLSHIKIHYHLIRFTSFA